MTFKELFPTFAAFKQRINNVTPSKALVYDTDTEWYNRLSTNYANLPFKDSDETRNVGAIHKHFSDFKRIYIKLIAELEKPLKELIINENKTESLSANEEPIDDDDVEQLIVDGGSNKFRPSVLNIINRYAGMPNIDTQFISRFRPLFSFISDAGSSQMYDSRISMPRAYQQFLEIIGKTFADYQKGAIEHFKAETNLIVDTQHLEDESVTKAKLEKLLQTLLETLTNKTTANETKSIANEKATETIKRDIGNYGNNIQTLDTKIEQNKNDLSRTKTSVSSNSAKIRTNEGEITNLKNKSIANEKATETIKRDIGNYGNNIQTLDTKIEQNKNDLSRTKTSVSSNSAKIRTNEGEITNLKNKSSGVTLNDVDKWHNGMRLYNQLDTETPREYFAHNDKDHYKKIFDDTLPKNNNEYLVLRNIITDIENDDAFLTINGVQQIGFNKGWLLDHLQLRVSQASDVGTDFKQLINSTTITFFEKTSDVVGIYFSSSFAEVHELDYTKSTGNFSSITKRAFSPDHKTYTTYIKWLHTPKHLSHDTPYYDNNLNYKNLEDAFINKGNVSGNIKHNIPLLTAIFSKNSNQSNFLNILENNTDYMQDNPIIVSQRNLSNVRVTFNWKKPLSAGIYKLRFLLNKNRETWVDFKLVNANLNAWYIYESKSNYSASARSGRWSQQLTEGKRFLRSSGKQAEVNLIFGNNGDVWTYRTGTGSRASSKGSYGTHQMFHSGEINSNDNTNVSAKPLVIDITATGLVLDSNTIISLEKVIGE